MLLLRLMVGGVFFWEGLLKFVYVNQGVGRFTKLGIPLSGIYRQLRRLPRNRRRTTFTLGTAYAANRRSLSNRNDCRNALN